MENEAELKKMESTTGNQVPKIACLKRIIETAS